MTVLSTLTQFIMMSVVSLVLNDRKAGDQLDKYILFRLFTTVGGGAVKASGD